MLRYRSTQLGFTILEMVITALVASVVIGLTGMLLMGGIRNKRAMEGRGGLLAAGAQVDELVRRDLERAGQRMFATYNISGVNIKTSGPDSLANDTLTTLAARGRALSNSTKTCSVLGTASSTDCMVLFGDARSDLKAGSLVLTGNPQTGGKILLITQVSDTVSLPCGTDCAQERVLVSKTVTGAVMDSVIVGHKITYDNGDVYHLSGACPAPEPDPNYTCENNWEYVQVGEDVAITTVANNGQNKPYTEVKFVDLTSAFGYPQATTWTSRSGAYGVPAVKTQEIRFTRYYLDRRQNQHPMLVKQSNLLPVGTFAVAEPVAYDVKSFLVQTQHKGQTGLARGVQLSAADLVVDETNPNFVSNSVAGEGESLKSYDFLKSYTTIASVRARFVVQDRRTATHDVAARVRKEIPMAVLVATNHLLDGGVFDPRMTETGYVEPTTSSANGWNSPPIAQLKASHVSISVGQTVTFTDNGSNDPDGSIVSWTLSLGDGNTTSGTGMFSSFTHTYNSVGTYSAQLEVADDKGAKGTYVIKIEVLPVNKVPTARFTKPANPVTGVWLTFDGSQSSDDDGQIVDYSWSFSDGQTASGKAATVMFHAAGSITVSLTVKDDRGATTTATETISVAGGNQAPTASITAPSCVTNPGYCQVNTEYTWDASASSDPEGPLARYVWDFGDGSPQVEGAVVKHMFVKGGSLTVKLTVYDSDGASSGATQAVAVNKAPVASLAMPPCAGTTTGCYVGVSYPFDGSGASDPDGTIGSWALAFGDGAETNSSSPGGWPRYHTYTSAGTYTVRYTVVDNQGGRDVRSASIVINSDERPTVICPDTTLTTGASATLTCTVRNNTSTSQTYTFASSTTDESIVTASSPGPGSATISGSSTINVSVAVKAGLKAGTAQVRLSATSGSQVGYDDMSISTTDSYAIALSHATNAAQAFTLYANASSTVGQAFMMAGSGVYTITTSGIGYLSVDKRSLSVENFSVYDTKSSSTAASSLAGAITSAGAGKYILLATSGTDWTAMANDSLRNTLYRSGFGSWRTLTLPGSTSQVYAALIDTDYPTRNREMLGSGALVMGTHGDGSLMGTSPLAPSENGRWSVKVTNKSSKAGQISLTLTCAGGVTNCRLSDQSGVAISKTKTLAPDSSQTVIVTYTAAGSAGSGTLKLDAAFETATATTDRTIVVTNQVTVPTPAIMSGPGDFDVLATSKGQRHVQITNAYREARAFSLAPYTSNSGVITVTTPASVALNPFETKTIVLDYAIGNVDNSATATYGVDASASGITTPARGNVVVATTLKAPTVRAEPSSIVIEPNQNGTTYFWVRNESNVSRTYSVASSVSGVIDTATPGVSSITLAPFDSVKVSLAYKVIRYAEEDSKGEITLNVFDNTFLSTATVYATTRLVLSNPVVVAPADFNALPGQSDTAYFSLRNSTNARRTFTLKPEKTGLVVSVGSAQTITMDAFSSTSIAVTWKLSDESPYLQTGTVKLTATDSISSGWDDVTITTAAKDDVPLVESTGDFEAEANQTGLQAFWVTNRSNRDKAITLVASNGGIISGVAVEGTNPLNFTPYEKKQILVKWTTAIDAMGGQTGTVTLKAADGALEHSATSTATITTIYGVKINDVVDQIFYPGKATHVTFSVTNTGNSKRWFAFEDLFTANANWDFEDDSGNATTAGWDVKAGSGTISFPTSDVSTSPNGSRVMRITGYKWMISNQKIPFDPNVLYRSEIWMRQVKDPTTGVASNVVWAGFVGWAADGTTLVNVAGNNSYGSQHYATAYNYALKESEGWRQFAGFVKGWGSTGGSANNNWDPNNPGVMHPDVRYISPLIIVNYPYDTSDGVTDVAGARIVAVSLSDPDGNEVRLTPPAPIELNPNTTASVTIPGYVGPLPAETQVTGKIKVFDQGKPDVNATGTVTGKVQEALMAPIVTAPADSTLLPERSGTAVYTVKNQSNKTRTFNLAITKTGDLTEATGPSTVTVGAYATGTVNVTWTMPKSVAGTLNTIKLDVVDGQYTGSATWKLTTALYEKNPTVIAPPSGLFTASQVSTSGMTCSNAALVDRNIASIACDLSNAAAGSYIQVDYGAGEARAITGLHMWMHAAGSTSSWRFYYSDDGSNWVDYVMSFVPSNQGDNEQYWTNVGAHRYWRFVLNSSLGASQPSVSELHIVTDARHVVMGTKTQLLNYTVTNETNTTRSLAFDATSTDLNVIEDPLNPGALSFAPYEIKTISYTFGVVASVIDMSQAQTALRATDETTTTLTTNTPFTVIAKAAGPIVSFVPADTVMAAPATVTRTFKVKNQQSTTRNVCFEATSTNTAVVSDPSEPACMSFAGSEVKDIPITISTLANTQNGQYATVNLRVWDQNDATLPQDTKGYKVTLDIRAPTVVQPADRIRPAPYQETVAFSVKNNTNAPRTLCFVASSSNTATVLDPADPACQSYLANETKNISVTYDIPSSAVDNAQSIVALRAYDQADPNQWDSNGFAVQVDLLNPTVTAPADRTRPAPYTETVGYTVQNNTGAPRTMCFVASSSNTATVADPADPACVAFAGGEIKTISVTYNVPSSALDNTQSTITLKAYDQGDPTVTHQASFVLTVDLLNPTVVAPANRTRGAPISETVAYAVTNNTGAPRTFCFVATSSNTATVADPADPACTTFSAGQTQNISVTYSTINTANDLSTSTLTLEAYDQGDPTVRHSAGFVVTVDIVEPTITPPSSRTRGAPITETVTFLVTNNTQASRWICFEATSSNHATVPDPADPACVALGANISGSINVTYSTLETSKDLSASTITLKAYDQLQPTIFSTSSFTVTVDIVEPTVVDPGNRARQPGVTETVYYSVTNNTQAARVLCYDASSDNESVALQPADPACQSYAANETKSVPITYTVLSTALSDAFSNMALRVWDKVHYDTHGLAFIQGQDYFLLTVAPFAPTVTAPANQSGGSRWYTTYFQVKNNNNNARNYCFVASSSNTAIVNDPADPACQSIGAGTTVSIKVDYYVPVTVEESQSATVTLQAYDQAQPSYQHSATFTWTAVPTMANPTVTMQADAGGDPGVQYTYSVTVTNNTNLRRMLHTVVTNNGDADGTVNNYPGNIYFNAFETKTLTFQYTVASNSVAGNTAQIWTTTEDNLQTTYRASDDMIVTTNLVDKAPSYTWLETTQYRNPGVTGQTNTARVTNNSNTGRSICFASSFGDGNVAWGQVVNSHVRPNCVWFAAYQTQDIGGFGYGTNADDANNSWYGWTAGYAMQAYLQVNSGYASPSQSFTISINLIERFPNAWFDASYYQGINGALFQPRIYLFNFSNTPRTICTDNTWANGNVAASSALAGVAANGCLTLNPHVTSSFFTSFSNHSTSQWGWYAYQYTRAYISGIGYYSSYYSAQVYTTLNDAPASTRWVTASGSAWAPETWHTITYCAKNNANTSRTINSYVSSNYPSVFSDPGDVGNVAHAPFEEKCHNVSTYAYWVYSGAGSTMTAVGVNTNTNGSGSSAMNMYIANAHKTPEIRFAGNLAGGDGAVLTQTIYLTNRSNHTTTICDERTYTDGNVAWGNVIEYGPGTGCLSLGMNQEGSWNANVKIRDTSQGGWYAYAHGRAYISGVGYHSAWTGFQVYTNVVDRTPFAQFWSTDEYMDPGRQWNNPIRVWNHSNVSRNICLNTGQRDGSTAATNVFEWGPGQNGSCWTVGAETYVDIGTDIKVRSNAPGGQNAYLWANAYISGIGMQSSNHEDRVTVNKKLAFALGGFSNQHKTVSGWHNTGMVLWARNDGNYCTNVDVGVNTVSGYHWAEANGQQHMDRANPDNLCPGQTKYWAYYWRVPDNDANSATIGWWIRESGSGAQFTQVTATYSHDTKVTMVAPAIAAQYGYQIIDAGWPFEEYWTIKNQNAEPQLIDVGVDAYSFDSCNSHNVTYYDFPSGGLWYNPGESWMWYMSGDVTYNYGCMGSTRVTAYDVNNTSLSNWDDTTIEVWDPMLMYGRDRDATTEQRLITGALVKASSELGAPQLLCDRDAVLVGLDVRCAANRTAETEVAYFTFDWGDGRTTKSDADRSGAVAAHAFETPGEYVVGSYVTSFDGTTSSYRATTVTVLEDRAPDAPTIINSCGDQGCPIADTVSLVAVATDPDASLGDYVSAVYVELGDGRSKWVSPRQVLFTQYESTGVYTVKMTAYDRNGVASRPAFTTVRVRDFRDTVLTCEVPEQVVVGEPFMTKMKFHGEVPLSSAEVESPLLPAPVSLSVDQRHSGSFVTEMIATSPGQHAITCTVNDKHGRERTAKAWVDAVLPLDSQ